MRIGELPVGDPLQPRMEGDLVRRLGGEGAHGIAICTAECLGPFAEPMFALVAEARRQRLEGRMPREGLTAFVPEAVERGEFGPREGAPEPVEQRALERPDAGVVNERLLPQAVQASGDIRFR